MAERDSYLARPIPAEEPAERTRPYFERVAELDDVTKMQYVDYYTWLLHDILLKADKMSMASSLELRVPFLDREVLKVALAIPARYRVRRGATKVALRRAALRRIPEKTAMKRKLGFPVPLNDWLRQDPYYGQVRAGAGFELGFEDAPLRFAVGVLIMVIEPHFAGSDHTRAGEQFPPSGHVRPGESCGPVRVDAHGGEDRAVFFGELGAAGSVVGVLADGDTSAHAGLIGTLQDGVDLGGQILIRQVAMCVDQFHFANMFWCPCVFPWPAHSPSKRRW